MKKSKLSKKSSGAKNRLNPVKSVKSKKPVTPNYLAPLHEITTCIEKDYQELDKLLKSIPVKLKKVIAEIQSKIKKSKETQVKTGKLLAETKIKQKLKPTIQHKQNLSKHEKFLAETKNAYSALTDEITSLTQQLQTCGAMGREYSLIEKSVKKVKTDFQKQGSHKLKKINKPKKKIKAQDLIKLPTSTKPIKNVEFIKSLIAEEPVVEGEF